MAQDIVNMYLNGVRFVHDNYRTLARAHGGDARIALGIRGDSVKVIGIDADMDRLAERTREHSMTTDMVLYTTPNNALNRWRALEPRQVEIDSPEVVR